jgi:hypothetical protein
MTTKFRVISALLLAANFAVLLFIYWKNAKKDCILKAENNVFIKVQLLSFPLQGYLLNLKYDGQLASAEHALVLQQCWLSALNLSSIYIVEPFLRTTVYQGYPPGQFAREFKNPLVFSDLHDLAHYNSVSRRRGFAQVAKWEHFLENSPRRVVFVNLASPHFPQTNYSIECRDTSSRNCCLIQPIPDGMNFFLKNGFCIVRVINLHGPEHTLGDPSVRETLFGPWKPEDVTVIFNHWTQANSAQHFSQCYRIFRRSVMTDLLVPSKQLLKESRAYRERFLGGRAEHMLSVMMRVERVIEQSVEGGHAVIAKQNRTTRKAYLDKCFMTLFETVNRLGAETRPFVMTDIGRFSSSSWNRILLELNYSKTEARHVFDMARASVERLANQSFADWEYTFVHSANSSRWRSPAYVAALQRAIAVEGDCLLLFGGGNFQEVALSAYLQKHPSKSTQCVRFVCVSRSLKRNLLDIIL